MAEETKCPVCANEPCTCTTATPTEETSMEAPVVAPETEETPAQ